MTIMLFYKVNQSLNGDFIIFVLQVLILPYVIGFIVGFFTSYHWLSKRAKKMRFYFQTKIGRVFVSLLIAIIFGAIAFIVTLYISAYIYIICSIVPILWFNHNINLRLCVFCINIFLAQ